MIFIPIDKFVSDVCAQLRGYVPEGEKIFFDLSLICPHDAIDFEIAKKIGVCVNCTIDYRRDGDLPTYRNSIQFSVTMNKDKNSSLSNKIHHNVFPDLDESRTEDSQQLLQDKGLE